MGFLSARHGWLGTLLASFLALLVLVSAVDAVACGPETGPSHAAEAAWEVPGDAGDDGGPSKHALCPHGHCHHQVIAADETPTPVGPTPVGRDLNGPPPPDGFVSRFPTGPDRPPRG
jgi:hypothetical protein